MKSDRAMKADSIKKEKFIFTDNPEAARVVRDHGYIEIPTATGFLFINDYELKPLTFENIDASELVFTNTICL